MDKTPCGSLPVRKPSGAGPKWKCTRVDPLGPADETNPCTQYGVPDGSITCDGRDDQDVDTDLRSSGLNPKDLLKWRWLCATGVYHA